MYVFPSYKVPKISTGLFLTKTVPFQHLRRRIWMFCSWRTALKSLSQSFLYFLFHAVIEQINQPIFLGTIARILCLQSPFPRAKAVLSKRDSGDETGSTCRLVVTNYTT